MTVTDPQLFLSGHVNMQNTGTRNEERLQPLYNVQVTVLTAANHWFDFFFLANSELTSVPEKYIKSLL
jgi:hypothetical protein